MVFRFRHAVCALAMLCTLVPLARAQSAAQPPVDARALRAAIDDLKKDFDARLAALEGRLAAVEKTGAQATGAQATGASVTNSKVFNPDIAVIGDFLGAL